MDAWLWVIVVVAILATLAVGTGVYRDQQARRLRERQTKLLRDRFGPEYSHTVEEYGDVRRAEPILMARARRVDALGIRPLTKDEVEQFSQAWRSAQAQFVDDPPGAIARAEELVAEVMQARGYPVGTFEQRAADVSVDHPNAVEDYRSAHEVAQRQARGEASIDDLRDAMVHYRRLFQDLLEVRERQYAEV